MKKTVLIVTMIIFLNSPIMIYAQGISYLGSTLWSGVNDVKVQGHYAYCAFFNGLVILDISNPASPTFVSQYYIGGDWNDYPRRPGQRLCISGNYVYFAADYEGLQIINVSVPAHPSLAYEFSTPTYASDVFVLGNYAYVVCIYGWQNGTPSSLIILNVADPANPIFVGNCNIASDARGVYVQGNYAYVADDLGGLQIVDVSDPTNPVIVGNYDTSNYALGVVVSGHYAYVAWGYSGLVIVDVTDPANPVSVGRWSDPLNFWVDGVFVLGNYAYLATDGHFLIINISDPINPALMGSLSAGWNLDVFVNGNYAYVAALTNGLHVINISDPSNPTLVGRYATPTVVNDVFISGNYAYAACVASGLNIVDITDPSHPVVIENWIDTSLYYSPMAVNVSGNYAYLGTYKGVRVLNVSNPGSPTPMGKCDFFDSYPAEDLFVREPYVYLARYSDGLYIINVSDATHPTITGHYATPDRAYGVYVSGNFAYVADIISLQIVDISDPANPTLTASWTDIHGSALRVYVLGDYAYVADGNGYHAGLQIINISDPVNPIRVGLYEAQGSAADVYVSGNYAYLAESRTYGWTQGMEVVDISDPNSPALMESFKTPGEGLGVAVSGNNIYLADEYSMMILNSNLTGIKDSKPIPFSFSLSQNYPNPFNASTSISYSLSKSGAVNFSIYNLLGQKVATLSDGRQNAGEHTIIWNAKDFPSGLYFARLESDGDIKNIKMILLK